MIMKLLVRHRRKAFAAVRRLRCRLQRATFCRLLERRALVFRPNAWQDFFLSDVAEWQRGSKEGKRFRDDSKTLKSKLQFSIKLSRVHISSRLRLADVLLLLKTLFVIVTSLYHLHHQQVEQQSQINLIDKLAVGDEDGERKALL